MFPSRSGADGRSKRIGIAVGVAAIVGLLSSVGIRLLPQRQPSVGSLPAGGYPQL